MEKEKEGIIKSSIAEFLINANSTEENSERITYLNGKIYLSAAAMATLFECSQEDISASLNEAFEMCELEREQEEVQQNGKSIYSLEAMLAAGFRVHSAKAVQLRRHLISLECSYITKGYALDTDRMKNGPRLGNKYFEELTEAIKEIRASKRRFYQKLGDIFATSIDYDRSSVIAKSFYAELEAKMNISIARTEGKTELLHRADSQKENMGLLRWRSYPDGKIMLSDALDEENYLDAQEHKALVRAANSYLELAEALANKKQAMTMEDWSKCIGEFLKLSTHDILEYKESTALECERLYAQNEYMKYREFADLKYKSDLDRLIEEIK